MRILCLALAIACAHAQKLEFDVASVKLAAAGNRPVITQDAGGTFRLGAPSVAGGPGTSTPERYSNRFGSLRDLLVRAFGLVERDAQVAGPGWIDSEHYDVAVTMPPTTTEAQFREMLQNLVIKRFKLTLHHESKNLPVYELTVGKDGHKLTPSTDARAESGSPDFKNKDKDGFVVTKPGYSGMVMSTGPGPSGQVTQNWVYGQTTLETFAGMLKNAVGRRVLDKTGLEGKYDFRVYYEPERRGAAPAIPDHPVLTVFDALEQQLGLRLVEAKAAVDVVVVDAGDKTPTEN